MRDAEHDPRFGQRRDDFDEFARDDRRREEYSRPSEYRDRRRPDGYRRFRRDYGTPTTDEVFARMQEEEESYDDSPHRRYPDDAYEDEPYDRYPSRRRWDDDEEEYRSPPRRASRYHSGDKQSYRKSGRPLPFTGSFRAFTHRIATIAKSQRTTLFQRLKHDRRAQIVLVLVILLGCIAPALIVSAAAYQQYSQLKTLGTNGFHELLAIKDAASLAEKSADPNSGFEGKGRAVFQPAVLAQIKVHSDNALADFQQLNTIVANRQGVLGLAAITPFASRVDALGRVARIGIDVATIGQNVAASGGDFTPIFQGKLLDPTGGPIFSPATFTHVIQFFTTTRPQIDDAARQIAGLQIADLPVSRTQAAQFQQVVGIFPGLAAAVDTIVDYHDALRWLLGIDSPRLFLVQTMDRAELRPTGGFTGQFGTVSVNGGRIGKISLADVNVLDQSQNNPFHGVLAPEPYTSWWPFVGFGLRDANLSADYPTSAKLAMYYFTHEGGPKVDGVINFSPLLIEHLLKPDVLGPLTLPCYNDTITADNLEDKLHYYQLGAGVAKQAACAKDPNTTLRKQFSAALSEQLQTHLRTAPPDRQGKAIASIIADVKDKEAEIYLNDPTAEAFLTKSGADNAMVRDPHDDTTMVVQTNIGGNKGSIYVTTQLQEHITITSNGDAQHTLTLTLSYNPGNHDVYGFQLNPGAPQVTTYRDYLRVYVPKSARLVKGMGFDQTQSPPLCTDGKCVPKGAPACTNGPFKPGYSPYSSRNEGAGNDTIDQIGGPTNTTSDEPGLAMFGGLVVLPSSCTATISLQWTVPQIAGSGGQPYTFVEQSQSDAFPNTNIQIQSPHATITKQINPQYNNATLTLP